MNGEITGVVPYVRKPHRITARNERGDAFVPMCFEEPCLGGGCVRKGNCSVFIQICAKLAEYEDTGLRPSEVEELLERVRERG